MTGEEKINMVPMGSNPKGVQPKEMKNMEQKTDIEQEPKDEGPEAPQEAPQEAPEVKLVPDPEAMGYNELLDYIKPLLEAKREYDGIIKRYRDQIKELDDNLGPYKDRLMDHLEAKHLKGKRTDRGIKMDRGMTRKLTADLHALSPDWQGLLTRTIPPQVKLITVKEMEDLIKSREDIDPEKIKEMLGYTEIWTLKVTLED